MSARGTFAFARQDELPGHMDGPKWRAAQQVLGEAQDTEIAIATDAVLMRYPPRCPDDALDHLGAASGIERFSGETDASYGPRVQARWPTWKKAGSKQAIIDSLNAWGIPDVACDNDYEVSPPWDGAWWTRCRIRLGPNFGAFVWNPTNPPTAAERAQIQRQVLKFKWAWAYPVDVVLDYGGAGSFTFYIGPLISYGFIIGVNTIGGFQPI